MGATFPDNFAVKSRYEKSKNYDTSPYATCSILLTFHPCAQHPVYSQTPSICVLPSRTEKNYHANMCFVGYFMGLQLSLYSAELMLNWKGV